jgi:hypothetical protein
MSRTKGIKAFGVLALAALLVFGLSLTAFAHSGETEASALLFTYYDARSAAESGLGLTDNYYTVTNTSTEHWVQAHVRIRTGDRSVELLDFDILLSPMDVFTFDIYEGGSGAMTFASCDTKTLLQSGFDLNVGDCFVIDTDTILPTGNTMLALIEHCEGETQAEALDHSKRGYVEVISEGKIDVFSDTGSDKYKCSEDPDFWVIPNSVCTGDSKPAACCDGVGTGTCGGPKTLLNTDSDLSLYEGCDDIDDPTPDLIGKQYYAVLSNGVAEQLAAVNAEGINDYHYAIFHWENFDAETTSSNCSGDDDGGINSSRCFAYIDPAPTAIITDGADDMNACFYQDIETFCSGTSTPCVSSADCGGAACVPGTLGIGNKFGAAATFGPTIADLYYQPRDGSLVITARNLSRAVNGFGERVLQDIADADNGAEIPKRILESHYFNASAPIPVDLLTSFAVIFPIQHFIGESDKLSVGPVFDLEENVKTTQITKFISPGLPTAPSVFPEASLFTPTYPFVEGWIRMSPSATNVTAAHCTTPGSTTSFAPDCSVCNDHDGSFVDPNYECTGSYGPGITGLAITHGANYITATPLHYEGEHEVEN